MITAIIDDESLAVSALIRKLKKLDPNGSHEGFVHLSEFMDYADNNRVEVAFVDLDLGGTLSGIDLARHLSEKYRSMNIVIYTGHAEAEYKAEALSLYVSGYLVKPVTDEELKEVLCHLRHPITELSVQCFGHFEVFYGTSPLKFDRKDSKEVLAYLIDKRGAMVSEDELRWLLFNEEEDGSEKRAYIRNIIYDIRKSLSRCGVPKEIVINTKGCYSIDCSMLRCDYYDFLDGANVPAAKLGQYMEQYSWAAPVRYGLFGR